MIPFYFLPLSRASISYIRTIDFIPYPDTVRTGKIASKYYVDSLAATISGGSATFMDDGNYTTVTGTGTLLSPYVIDITTGIPAANIGAGTVDNTEYEYLNGVTSGIQGQLNGKQPSNADLTAIAGLTPTNDDIIQRKAGAWTNRTMAQLKTDLVLVKGDVGLGNVDNTSDATKNSAIAALTNKDLTSVTNTFPTFNQNTTGSAATLTTARTIWGQNFNGSANVSGTLAMGTADITSTGSLGATGARLAKGWFTDIESTNVPTVGGVALPTASSTTTFTNKTLTSPIISSISNTGTLTLPTVTSTIVSYKESNDASTATPTPVGDARQNRYYLTALATAPTFAVPSGTPANGNELLIRIKDNGTARALAWNPIYRGGTLIALPSTTTISKTMYVQFIYNSADSKWDLVGLTDGLSIPFWLLLAFTRIRIRIRNSFRIKYIISIALIFTVFAPVQAQVLCNGWRYAAAPSFPSTNRWGRWVATTGITHSSNRVSAWSEYYGNGKIFSEATSTKQPLWNGTDAITFTGVSPRIEDLACSSALTASYTIYVIIQETININGDAGFQISDNGTMYMYSVREAGVNKYRVYGNAFANSITSTANITAGTYYFLKAKINGASSSIKLNTTQTTGNLGSLNISTPLVLGYVGNASSNFTIKDFAIFTGVHDEAGVETAYNNLYGVP